MSSLINTLNSISLNIFIYVGLVELVVGTIGNGLTILVFSQAPLRGTRTMPCIIVLAVFNIIFLTYILTLRIIAGTYGRLDYTFGDNIICALRYFIPYNSMTIVYFLLSWIAIDRYLCSCRQASRRAWSTKKILQHVTIVICLFSLLVNWPYLVYGRNGINEITGKIVCGMQDPTLLRFNAYFQVPVIFAILPVTVLGLFAFLTIRNIRTTRQTTNRLERQMTRVLILQTVVAACCSVPIATDTMYTLSTTTIVKSSLRLTIEQLINVVAFYIFAVLFSSNFYMYFIGSKEVRDKFKSSFCWFKNTNNQVIPANTEMEHLGTTTNFVKQLPSNI